jgi:hypothetical protein
MKISRFFSVALAALVWSVGTGTTLAGQIFYDAGVNFFLDSDEETKLAADNVVWLVYLSQGVLGAPGDMFDSGGVLDSLYYDAVHYTSIGINGAGTFYGDYDYGSSHSVGDKFVIMAFNAQFSTDLGIDQAPLAAHFGVSDIFTVQGDVTGDWFIIEQNYSTVHPVPEPGALALFGLGALGMLVRRRKATNI